VGVAEVEWQTGMPSGENLRMDCEEFREVEDDERYV